MSMRDSVVRNLGATTPSLRQEAEDRRKRVKLGLWSLLGTCSLIALVKVLSLMASDLCGLLIELTSSPKSTVKMLPISRDGEDMADETQRDSSGVPFSSEKIMSILGDATDGLDSWRNGQALSASESISAATSVLEEEINGMKGAVRALQGSLGDAHAMGNVAGVVSWDLEKSQNLLIDNQAAVAIQNADVLALARQIIDEHNSHEVVVAAAALAEAANANDAPSEQGRRVELVKTLQEALADADVTELKKQIQKEQEKVDAALTTEGAEKMARPFLEAAGSKGRRGRVGEVSDEEIERVVQETVQSLDNAPGTRDGCLSVERAQNLTKVELERYGADQTGIPDYAMAAAGARVVPSLTSATFEPHMSIVDRVRGIGRSGNLQSVSPPAVAINHDSHLGRCWPMKGSRGELTVKLSQPIMVEMVSIEHAARSLLLNKGASTPKDFSVVGYAQGWTAGGNSAGDVLISGAEYSLEGDVIQFFEVAEEYRRTEYVAVALEVESNYGEGAYTCLYRFRVHGTPT